MALRLRRGTDQQRQGITFAEGELIYTTDTKEVYVGDGTTQGGRPVSIGTVDLGDLGDVANTAPIADQILVYNGDRWEPTNNPALDVRGNIYSDDSTLLVDAINGEIVGPINTSSVTSSGPIVGDLVGDVTGDVTGNLTGDVTADTVTANSIVGNFKGTIVADDSTVLVDAVSGTVRLNNGEVDITDDTITAGQAEVNISSPTEATSTKLNIWGKGEGSQFKLHTKADSDSDNVSGISLRAYGTNLLGSGSTPTQLAAGDTINKVEAFAYDPNTSANEGLVYSSGIYFSVDDNQSVADDTFKGKLSFITNAGTGSSPNVKYLTFDADGRLAVNKSTQATAELDVEGSVHISEVLKIGSLTTAERDALTAADGMIIFNSTDNVYQAYKTATGSWTNFA